MSKFQKGDRVRVYERSYIVNAVIEGFESDGTLGLRDDYGDSFIAHPKQCRKFVKRKRREWWLLVEKGAVVAIYDQFIEEVSVHHDLVHVREVRRK